MTLSPGDRLPFWTATGLDRSFHSSDSQAGRAAVLIVVGADFRPRLDTLFAAFAARAGGLAACDCDLAVMLPFAAIPTLYRERERATAGLPARICSDDFLASCGVGPGGAAVFAVDRSGRLTVAERADAHDPATLADAALASACHAASRMPPAAPVLAIPALFDGGFCQALIGGFERAATFDSPVSGAGADGRASDRIDHARKHRRDWLLGNEDPLHAAAMSALARRCIPELNRAFQHRAAHVDRILVVRYDAGAGHFRRHRDNAAPATAFRQFALSVNLNTGDYEGGDLCFPEYDGAPHRPARGEAVVFSASLLHEVTPVTAGRRYALLTFLHDAGAEASRHAPLRDAA